ncbi:phosphatase PAP2 family protein [Actinotalea sp. Marseille-Q4924]|uniref:phosphatase PAP2 family protein n=1 Tax=Actinotalea sp. Marseille-Q4924 TaxID=2866571 RepID=UPI001CE3FF71|nr:phosphatase PAP2 family protein [Actinotalea sp. Marseille-Q4924]
MADATPDPSTPPGRRRRAAARAITGGRSAWSWVGDRRAQLAVVAGVVLVVLGLAGFVAVFDAVQERDDLAALDRPVLEGLRAARSEPVSAFLAAVSAVTGPVVLPVVVVVSAVVWGVLGRSWWQAALLAGAMVLSTLVSVTLKAVIARPRPPVDAMLVPGAETTYSFPSGHTIGTATFLLVVAYLLWVPRPTAAWLLGGLALVAGGVVLVALSRLYLGYHFVTDVVASMALAVAVLGVVVAVDRRRAARAVTVATQG